MPTATKTWDFPSDAMGLTDVGDDANLSVAWSSSDGEGSPKGDLEWLQSAGATTSERARKSSTDTWETLFGIPAGSTVTDVTVNSFTSLDWANTNVSNVRVRMRFLNSSNTTVHSAGDIHDVNWAPGTGGSPIARGAGTSRAVDATYQPSNTGVKLEIQFSDTISGSPTVDSEQDNIVVQITYTVGGGAPTKLRVVYMIRNR